MRGKVLQPRIVTDQEKRVRLARFTEDGDERVRTRVVDALVAYRARCAGEGRCGQRPGLLSPFCRGDQGDVGNEPVMCHIGADRRRVGAAAFHEFAVAVALPWPGALGFGMSQQHQSAHRRNVAFRA